MRLRTHGVRKIYPGTIALNDVSIEVPAGRVTALIGKNGAGKSTLIKILSGATKPTRGRIELDGQTIRMRSPKDAIVKGISTVYQELSLVQDMTVGENILLGRWPRRRALGGLAIDWRRLYRDAQERLDLLGVQLRVRERVGSLSVAHQQVVEIAKAMSFEPSVLMLDEPTSALSGREVDRMLTLIRELTHRDVGILYVSHRLHELPRVADSIVALRDGSHAGTVPIADATPSTLVEMMFGETVRSSRPTDFRIQGDPVLEARHLRVRGKLADVGFSLHRGEVLGIAGMLGSGRTELLLSLFGALPLDGGEIVIDGTRVGAPTPARMKRLGLGLAPEHRKEQGLFPNLSTRDNLTLAALMRMATNGVISKRRQLEFAERNVRELHIRVPDIEQSVTTLSGGNQQKVVVGNWLNTEPRIMLLDEPTRGIDVQAKQQIFEMIRGMSRRGISSIVVSSELEELLEICHRILVLRDGRIQQEVRPEDTRLDELFAMSMGKEG